MMMMTYRLSRLRDDHQDTRYCYQSIDIVREKSASNPCGRITAVRVPKYVATISCPCVCSLISLASASLCMTITVPGLVNALARGTTR